MFLRRSFARAVYVIFCRYIWGLAPPYQKLATLVTTHTFLLGAPPPPPHALTHGTPLLWGVFAQA